eukprot:8152329-Alexandrium_andersonii.AAC.1
METTVGVGESAGTGLPRTNPRPCKVFVHRAPQRAGAARAPYKLRFSLGHTPASATSGGSAARTSSST